MFSILLNRQRLRPARQPAPYNGFEDRDTFGNDDEEDDDAPHFREIPEKESFDYEVVTKVYIPKSVQNIWKSGKNNQMNSNQEIKPFVAFGKEDAEGGDLGESSMKGVNFYQQYGQHDDRLVQFHSKISDIFRSKKSRLMLSIAQGLFSLYLPFVQ